jgi:hypothetical protein
MRADVCGDHRTLARASGGRPLDGGERRSPNMPQLVSSAVPVPRVPLQVSRRHRVLASVHHVQGRVLHHVHERVRPVFRGRHFGGGARAGGVSARQPVHHTAVRVHVVVSHRLHHHAVRALRRLMGGLSRRRLVRGVRRGVHLRGNRAAIASTRGHARESVHAGARSHVDLSTRGDVVRHAHASIRRAAHDALVGPGGERFTRGELLVRWQRDVHVRHDPYSGSLSRSVG